MSKEPKQIFFQSHRYTHGQQAHEKMRAITYHQGNAIQNHNEIPTQLCHSDYHHKKTNNK